LFCKAVSAFTYVAKLTNGILRKFAIHHETSERIALPGRAVLRPFKDFFENTHFLNTILLEL